MIKKRSFTMLLTTFLKSCELFDFLQNSKRILKSQTDRRFLFKRDNWQGGRVWLNALDC